MNVQRLYSICSLSFYPQVEKSNYLYSGIPSQSGLTWLPGTGGKLHTFVSITNWTRASLGSDLVYFYVPWPQSMTPAGAAPLHPNPSLRLATLTLCIPHWRNNIFLEVWRASPETLWPRWTQSVYSRCFFFLFIFIFWWLTEEYKVQRWLIWTGKMFVPTTQPMKRAVDINSFRFLSGT